MQKGRHWVVFCFHHSQVGERMTLTPVSGETNAPIALNGNKVNQKKIEFYLGKRSLVLPQQIRKRDGSLAKFDLTKIEAAVQKCFDACDQPPLVTPYEITVSVANAIAARWGADIPTVENVQDIVEHILQASGEFEAASRYSIYRRIHAEERELRSVPEEVKQAFAASAKYFPSPIQQFMFYDKYSRFNWELGRRETWIETVDRAVSFLRELSHDLLDDSVYEEIRTYILNMWAMPSMRLLATAGEAARRNNVLIYNCSATPICDLEAFGEVLSIAMNGCGTGVSVEPQFVEQLPRIKRQKKKQEIPTHVIGDSTEGWVEALMVGIKAWFNGGDVEFDGSLCRPAGSILRTKGGRASGPEPFLLALHNIRNVILSRQGSTLRPIDAHDVVCHIGSAVIPGGVRRTATISLFGAGDTEMRNCKNGEALIGNSQRWNANNSEVWPDEFDQTYHLQHMLDMVNGKRGEPGIFSRANANRTKPKRRKRAGFLTNPCVTGDTWVMTDGGPRRVLDLVGEHTIVRVDGQNYTAPDGFFRTGIKPVYTLSTQEGYTVNLTADHKVLLEDGEWVEAQNLRKGDKIRLHDHDAAPMWDGYGSVDDGYIVGHFLGDGTWEGGRARLCSWGDDDSEREVRENIRGILNKAWRHQSVSGAYFIADDAIVSKYLPVGHKGITDVMQSASSSFNSGLLSGLFDTDGHVEGDSRHGGISIRLSQSNLDLLVEVQRILLRFGIRSKINMVRPAGVKEMPDGRGGFAEYQHKTQWRLIITSDADRFMKYIGFGNRSKYQKYENLRNAMVRGPYAKPFVSTFESLEYVGEEEVFDITVPVVHAFDANGLYVHNCGEIILRPFEFCNLSIAVARPEDTEETLAQKVRVATIIGTIQSMATHFPGLRDEWRINAEEERLLGVDITGQQDSPVAQDPAVQRAMKQIAIDVNVEFAARLGINPSAAITTGKPGGNSSQLLDCASGIGRRYASFFIRRARIDAKSPIYRVYRAAGVPMNPENGQSPATATTWVIDFPMKAPEGAHTQQDATAIEQLEYWLQVKQNYTEHNPSTTILYEPHEVIDMTKWVWDHRDWIGGITFLPKTEAQYSLAPYEEITEEEYERLVREFPPVDFSQIYRYEVTDMSNAAQELSCFAGSCDA
jgi:ribonucleotide reductase, class II